METEEAREARLAAAEIGMALYHVTVRNAEEAARAAARRVGVFNRHDRRAMKAKRPKGG